MLFINYKFRCHYTKAMTSNMTPRPPPPLSPNRHPCPPHCHIKAVIGWLCFGELLSAKWAVGASTIVLGLFLISLGSPQVVDKATNDNPDHSVTSTGKNKSAKARAS